MSTDENGLEVIPREEALRLARTKAVGRVALVVTGAPVVVPVNFGVLEEDVVFRTASASKLLAAASGSVISFEVDEFDPAARTGWSVLVSGPAAEIVEEQERAAADALAIESWAGPFDRYVRIASRVVTGRRLRRGATGGHEWFTDWDLGRPEA